MKKNVAGQKVRFSLFKNGLRIENPTLVAGDAKVDLDGAGQGNVNTTPTSDAAGLVTWSPTQAETNADVVSLLMLDAAGGEWDPVTQVFYTELETSVAAVLVDTAEIGAAGAGLTALGDVRIANLDAAVSSRATQAQILNDATPFAGANVDATISSRATQADILNDATPFAGADIDAAISTRATQADILSDATPFAGANIANLDVASSTLATAVSIAALNDISVADIMTYVVEGALTFEQMTRIFQAVLAGKSTGGGTNTISFRDVADSKNRVQATVDANGNRTAVAVDGT